MDDKVITFINDLIALDLACAAAYAVSAKACKDQEIRNKLLEFKGDHDRHVSELSEVVRDMGGEPIERIDAKGMLIEGYTMLSSQEDRTAVLAMKGNEELSNNAYASALQANLPNEIREMVMRNFEDERRHMTWLRGAVIVRGWDVEQPEIRQLAEQVRKAA
ncbi:DUF2383 domain-containing protein [Polyangium aurulentum]|uniref:DUF2383 domain-containing protein n=1 Tax=Polyangium aurulentum TaxID=2567896 RepID=UPI0010ADCF6E|nr:DUF2383 domain-containing protein [Polyangium aurulentum]UQA55419.1 PA2169 family four-helix-bundle protein [Polyangium aurulentum]